MVTRFRVLFREQQRSLSSLCPPGSSVWGRKGLNYTLSLWLAGEKMSLPSEQMAVPGPKVPLQGWGTEDKRSHICLMLKQRTEMARPKEALKGTKYRSNQNEPRNSTHSVPTPGLMWIRPTLQGLTMSLKGTCVLCYRPSNQLTLLGFLFGHVVHEEMDAS